MNVKTLFLSLALTLIVAMPIYAQESPIKDKGGDPSPVSQCADKVDNDNDGKVDKSGLTSGGKTYLPDPQCLVSGAICENGTKTCMSGSATTTGNCGSGNCLDITIKNPLRVDTIQQAIKLFMDSIIRIAIPFIVLFFIWSGLSLVLARGNPKKLEDAKKMIWYTIIGSLLILGAWTITNAIIGTVNSIAG